MATSWSVSPVRHRFESATVSLGPRQSAGVAFVLDPPYARLRAVALAPLAVGSILVTDLVAGITALAAGLAARRPSPWCPLVLLADQVPLTTDEVAAFEPFPGCLGRAAPCSRERETLIESVITAVRSRIPPTDETLVGYVVQRTACAAIEPALLAAVRGSPNQEGSGGASLGT